MTCHDKRHLLDVVVVELEEDRVDVVGDPELETTLGAQARVVLGLYTRIGQHHHLLTVGTQQSDHPLGILM